MFLEVNEMAGVRACGLREEPANHQITLKFPYYKAHHCRASCFIYLIFTVTLTTAY